MHSLGPEQRSGGNLTTQNKNSFHPEPDNRYYTRANFFSIRNNSRDGVPISEKYQTDADPADQEVFDEMM